MMIGIAAAVPIFLTSSGIPTDVGGGATAVVIAGLAAKLMNQVEDEL